MTPTSTNTPSINVAALWSVTECARFLGKSPRWILSAIARRPADKGSIPHVRIGKSPRFFPNDIVEWVRLGCPPAEVLVEWKKPRKRA
jgi:hypothetical protein